MRELTFLLPFLMAFLCTFLFLQKEKIKQDLLIMLNTVWPQSGRVLALPCVPLLIVNLLPSLRVDFLSVNLSQKPIMAGFPHLLPPQHPSLPGSCPVSFLVHHQWASGLGICWLEGHWFKFRVCWYDQEGKMTFWQIIPSRCTFYLLSSGMHQGQLQKEILLVLGQKWEPLLVTFRWRLVLYIHELIKVLTIKQVFLWFSPWTRIF